MDTFNNKKNTLGKAAIVGRLNEFTRYLDHSQDSFKCSKNRTKPDESGVSPIAQFHQEVIAMRDKISELSLQIQENLSSETSLEKEYTRGLFYTTLKLTREKILKRLGHQPNICATVDMVIMLIETDLEANAHFSNLKTRCGVEDRQINSSSYGVDGDPNEKGRNECGHCPHKV